MEPAGVVDAAAGAVVDAERAVEADAAGLVVVSLAAARPLRLR